MKKLKTVKVVNGRECFECRDFEALFPSKSGLMNKHIVKHSEEQHLKRKLDNNADAARSKVVDRSDIYGTPHLREASHTRPR